MEIVGFNGFSCKSSNVDDIDINYNNKERQRWTNISNTAVMELCFLRLNQYEEYIMHNIWKERYDIELTEQCLCDQPRMIRKNDSITILDFENIRRKVFQKEKDIEEDKNDNTGERFYQDEENIHKNEATLVGTENFGEE